MDNNLNYTQEEIEKMLEKAKREMREMLNNMTPEERAAAEKKAQKTIEEDRASMQKLLDDAAKYASAPSAAEREKPKFCESCGAPAGRGSFCEYCGNPL